MGGLWRAPCKGAPGRNVNDLDAQPTVPLKDGFTGFYGVFGRVLTERNAFLTGSPK